jgi:hypothetical protein
MFTRTLIRGWRGNVRHGKSRRMNDQKPGYEGDFLWLGFWLLVSIWLWGWIIVALLWLFS